MVSGLVHLSSGMFAGGARGQVLLALCCEPAMGCHELVGDMLAEASRCGSKIVRRSLLGVSARDSTRRLFRVARETADIEEPPFVVIEDIPAADEDVALRQARALERIVRTGASVIITLLPEARQLLELLSDFKTLWSCDLVGMGLAVIGRSQYPQEIRALTRGIPSLIGSLEGACSTLSWPQTPPQSYFDALSSLVSQSLRGGLSDEETRARLAMLLVCHGTADELKEILGRDSSEILLQLRIDAPLFGVSSERSSFSCLCDDKTLDVLVSLPRIRSLCEEHVDILHRSLDLLVSRGQFGRIAALNDLADGDYSQALALKYGAELIEVRETELVRATLFADEEAQDLSLMCHDSLACALEAVFRKRPRSALDDPSVPALSHEDEPATLLALSREVLRGAVELPQLRAPSEDTLARRLWVHCEAVSLMAEGRITAALRLLVSSSFDTSSQGVSRALLDLDYEAARLLVCDRGERDEERLEAALSYLSAPSLSGLYAYPALVLLIEKVMVGDATAASDAEALSAKAEQCGDVVAQVGALIAGCICDLRGRTFARASVRARLAARLANGAGLHYLDRVSCLLADVARFMLGDRIEAPTSLVETDDLESVRLVVMTAMSNDPLESVGGPLSPRVPRDALWLVLVLSRGMGELSALVRDQLPQSWRRALCVAAHGLGGEQDERERSLAASVAASLERSPMGDSSVPIDITLLGGFAVYVRGTRVPDWKLERRNAKAVLEYLVLQNGGMAKRFQLVDQVWPGVDYVVGFNRAYQATSSLRSAIGDIEPGLDPFVASRSSHEISLDMGLVRCDVDAFRIIAREASDTDDPARALALARQAERLYAGDLYIPTVDAGAFITNLRDELRELYADAMVAGGEAALRLGQERTATRMATNALSVNDLREDAMVVLARALKASGRTVEAERRFRRFGSRLRRLGVGAPSGELLEAMGRRDEKALAVS